jgi:hypothetical protein
MNTYRGMEVQVHAFLTSEPAGGKWLTLECSHINPKIPHYFLDRKLLDPESFWMSSCRGKYLTPLLRIEP